MTNIINLADCRPKPLDPWRHAQPVLVTRIEDREELWSDWYFGVSMLIWATGSHTTPEPPMPPSGGTPAAANVSRYERLRVAA